MLVRGNKDKNTKLYLIMPNLDQATQLTSKGELWALTLATPCTVIKKYVFVADISQLCWEVESLNLIWLEYVTQDLFQNTQEFLVLLLQLLIPLKTLFSGLSYNALGTWFSLGWHIISQQMFIKIFIDQFN